MNSPEPDKADLDKLKARIRALRSKTTENGCTEEEALTAAAKVAELLDQYDLSLSDVELRDEPCERAEYQTWRKQSIPLDGCISAIAAFTDCRVWRERNEAGEYRFVFFGMRPDVVVVAHYLCELIDVALQSELVRFKATEAYRRHRPGDRKTVSTSFSCGVIAPIAGKLKAMKSERDKVHKVTGRDLVLVKAAVVDDELAKLGMRFAKRRPGRRMVAKHAYDAGQAAGEKIAINPGVARAQGARSVARRGAP